MNNIKIHLISLDNIDIGSCVVIDFLNKHIKIYVNSDITTSDKTLAIAYEQINRGDVCSYYILKNKITLIGKEDIEKINDF